MSAGGILRSAAAGLLTVWLAGLAAATLVRFAPGFGVDERELDPRLSEESRRAMRETAPAGGSLPEFCAEYWWRLLRGDLGTARATGYPVAQLLRERAPRTCAALAAGLAGGWSFGFGLALLVTAFPRPALEGAMTAASALLLCLPAAVLGMALWYSGAGSAAGTALALTVAPRVYRYARGILGQAAASAHVLMARARGLGGGRVLFVHVLAPAAPALAAVAATSVPLAMGAAVPVEVVCDWPGVGQLAWQAALQRDLPLLVHITLAITAVTVGCRLLETSAAGTADERG